MNTALNDQLDAAITKLARLHGLAVEGLTERQLVDAIRQAINCGDIKRCVRMTDASQTVVYVPFAEHQRLSARISELEQELALLRSQSDTAGGNVCEHP